MSCFYCSSCTRARSIQLPNSQRSRNDREDWTIVKTMKQQHPRFYQTQRSTSRTSLSPKPRSCFGIPLLPTSTLTYGPDGPLWPFEEPFLEENLEKLEKYEAMLLATLSLVTERSGGTQPIIITNACSRQVHKIASVASYWTSVAVGLFC